MVLVVVFSMLPIRNVSLIPEVGNFWLIGESKVSVLNLYSLSQLLKVVSIQSYCFRDSPSAFRIHCNEVYTYVYLSIVFVVNFSINVQI